MRTKSHVCDMICYARFDVNVYRNQCVYNFRDT